MVLSGEVKFVGKMLAKTSLHQCLGRACSVSETLLSDKMVSQNTVDSTLT